MSQPFYHLRPNKYVDRCLFVDAVENLSTVINLKNHRYIGFGSYLFDDFKLIHNRLNISKMISLEADPCVYKRAIYNIPYKCIKVINQTSTDYISTGDWGNKNTIIWLDYTAPAELAAQFNDVAALTNILIPNDIIKVTFNANSSSLGTPQKEDEPLLEYRFRELKTRIGEYIPTDATPNDVTTANYPILILQCLHKLLEGLFVETKYDRRYLLPLFSTVYKDGQTMVTFTGIVLDNHNFERQIRQHFKKSKYVNFSWDNPSKIDIPELTVKETLEMNKLLPSNNAQKQLSKKFDFVFENIDDEVASYISFYKYYPSFQSVNF